MPKGIGKLEGLANATNCLIKDFLNCRESIKKNTN